METEKVYAMPFAKIYPMLVDELAKGKVMEKIKRRNKSGRGKQPITHRQRMWYNL